MLVSHIKGIVEGFPAGSSLRRELVSVLEKFEDYACFDDAFTNEKVAPWDDAGAEAHEVQANRYEVFSKSLSKMPDAALTFLFNVFSGDHNSDLEAVVRARNGPWDC